MVGGAAEVSKPRLVESDFAVEGDEWTTDDLPSVEILRLRLEIRAANGQRPVLKLTGEMTVGGGEGSRFELNGLLVAGMKLNALIVTLADVGSAVTSAAAFHVTGFSPSEMSSSWQPSPMSS